LTIQPGVVVRMGAGANLVVKQGAIQAIGASAQPIVITSDAATPAPGDWGQLRMTAGTSSDTQLDQVRIEYGSGLVLENASPALNNLAISHHSGPAISIDLASSPVGRNLSASGNALNAITVPAGTVRGQVIWGLVGIPYLVRSGIVHVGQAPLALEPAQLKLSPGVVAMLRLTLNAAAPAGGITVDITSSVPSAATVAARVTVPEGQTGADVEVQALAVGATTLTASHPTLGTAVAQVSVVDLPALELAPAAPTVGVARAYPLSLRLPQPAPVGGLVVTLGNSDPTVLSAPANLRVPAGQQSLGFEVTGLADGVSRLSAQAEGYASALATVTVKGRALVLPGSVVVAPGAQTPVQLQLTEPAPAGGLSVSLVIAATTVAQVPATVLVPAGQSQASFNVSGLVQGTTQLTVTAPGYSAAQAAVRVDAINLDWEPSGDLSFFIDQTATRRVQLSKPAPQGGVTVQVTLPNSTIASAGPSEVFIPEGQLLGLTPLTLKALAEGATTLGLSASGLVGKTQNITVKPKFSLRLQTYVTPNKVWVGKGLNSYYNELRVQRLVNGAVANGADAVTVNLRCVAATVCAVPVTVTIPAGGSETYMPVTGLDIGSTQIEATAVGADASSIPVEVIAPVLQLTSLDDVRTTASARDDFLVSLQVPNAAYEVYQTAAIPLTVQLSLPDQTPSGIVSGIYNSSTGGALITQLTINPGSGNTDYGYVAQPAQAGTYRVGASIAGIASAQSAVQTVTASNLGLRLQTKVTPNKLWVGKGLYGSELSVQRVVNGSVAAGADEITVNLRCVVATICTVPSTVSIPAGLSGTSIEVAGLEIGSTQIEATAPAADSS
ncbi:MAG TPA: hypothetical protein VGC24_05575, partial [Burkholderiaceae bacterium]